MSEFDLDIRVTAISEFASGLKMDNIQSDENCMTFIPISYCLKTCKTYC